MTTTTSSTSLLSTAVQNSKANASSNTSDIASASSTSASTDSSTTSSLASLSSNFNTFLTLLTTQLKNQDPSSPMSSDSFTSELAQFASVEQQVDTNTNLKTLISLTQDGQQTTDMALVGKTATANTTQLPLQNGNASISFTTTSAEPIAIAVTDSSGTLVKTVEGTSVAGVNTWTWDGTNSSGTQLSDGSYSVAVETEDSSGNMTAVPFTVTGTVTGITRNGDTIYVKMGDSVIDMSDIASFTDSSSSSGTSSSGSSSS